MSGVKLGNPAPLGLLAFGMTVSVCGGSLGGMIVWWYHTIPPPTTTFRHLVYGIHLTMTVVFLVCFRK